LQPRPELYGSRIVLEFSAPTIDFGVSRQSAAAQPTSVSNLQGTALVRKS
jgi:hypothetical protein